MSAVFRPENREDEAYERDRQRKLDDELEAKRGASGLSPEQLSLQDAFSEGQRAGGFGHGASMNPYQDGCPEHREWERARMAVIGAALNKAFIRRSA
jgi:hypothetical protein